MDLGEEHRQNGVQYRESVGNGCVQNVVYNIDLGKTSDHPQHDEGCYKEENCKHRIICDNVNADFRRNKKDSKNKCKDGIDNF